MEIEEKNNQEIQIREELEKGRAEGFRERIEKLEGEN